MLGNFGKSKIQRIVICNLFHIIVRPDQQISPRGLGGFNRRVFIKSLKLFVNLDFDVIAHFEAEKKVFLMKDISEIHISSIDASMTKYFQFKMQGKVMNRLKSV